MRTLKIAKILFSLNLKTNLLLLETLLYLGWARILILVPFSKVASTLGVYMQETPKTPLNNSDLKSICQALQIVSNHTFWNSKCLVRAIAGMKMLERRRIESTLYLGTTKDERGRLIAHAWLRSGTYYVTGSEVMDKFTVVSKFAKRIGNNRN